MYLCVTRLNADYTGFVYMQSTNIIKKRPRKFETENGRENKCELWKKTCLIN